MLVLEMLFQGVVMGASILILIVLVSILGRVDELNETFTKRENDEEEFWDE